MSEVSGCLICKARKTIDAHLIPRAFALEVTTQLGQKHAIAHPDEQRFYTTNTGVYDANILCGDCDGRIGTYEGVVYQLLKSLRSLRAAPYGQIDSDLVEGNTVLKFAAGLAWKYCVTKPEYGQMSIGPYAQVLADVAFSQSPIPSSVDVAAIQMQHGDDQAYFYRTPMPDRIFGVNVVRFSVGGFLFFLKIDKRPNPSFPPIECWLRGKAKVSFLVAPADKFEEWNTHAQLVRRPDLRKYITQLKKTLTP